MIRLAGGSVCASLALFVASGLLEAQEDAPLGLGEPVEPPRFGRWLQGELEGFADGATVVVLLPDEEALGEVGDCVAAWRRTLAEENVSWLAVVREEGELPEWIGDLPVALDPSGETAARWLGRRASPRGDVVVFGPERRLVWRGALDGGVLDAIDRVRERRGDLRRTAAALEAWIVLVRDVDSMSSSEAGFLLEDVLRLSPRSGSALGFAYRIAAMMRVDAEEAGAFVEEAVRRLGAEPRPFALFAGLALRSAVPDPALGRRLAGVLEPLSRAAPHDPVVQLALLRALVVAGRPRGVGRQAMRVRKIVLRRAATAMEFAEILAGDSEPARHALLCEEALEVATKLGFDPRLRAALDYTVTLRCREDPDGAKKILDGYIEKLGGWQMVNDDCWDFLTQIGTVGRFRAFSTALAGVMLDHREVLGEAELDTVALARFVAGDPEGALELQKAAIRAAVGGSPEYRDRLRRYERAVAARGAAGKGRR